MEQYYFNRLPRGQQATYQALLQGLLDLSPEFQVPRLDGPELADVFFQLRLDHPEIFWATGFRYKFYPDSPYVIFIPEYLFDRGKIREHQKALSARIAKLTRPAQSLSQWEKERYVHDFICGNVRYDKLKKPYSHEIIGPLGQGVGVCEGIAKSVKALCDALGLWCIIALCDNNPAKGIKYRHTWNIIRLEGKYYHLDATFDNTLTRGDLSATPEIRYDYFNLSDKNIFRDHEPAILPIPVCSDGDGFYYKVKKLSFTKTEDVSKRLQQAAKKGKPVTFHWRGGYLTREVLTQLAEIIRTAAAEWNRVAHIRLNHPQAVLRVEFTDPDVTPAGGLTLEQANEGETLTQGV